MKTMTVDGVEYVEAPERRGCNGCAFEHGDMRCVKANVRTSLDRIGVCSDRRVIYIRAPESAPK